MLEVVYQFFLSFFLSAILPSFPSSPSCCSQGWRISIAVELTGSVVWIGQRRGSTVAALTCVCIAEPQPGNTRSILMTSPTLCSRLPPCVCCWNKLALSRSERKEQASVKEQELPGKRRGCPWANGEGESTGGRRGEADSASGLGLAHTLTHRKRRGEGILSCIVETSIAYCSASVSFPSGGKVLTQFCPFLFWIFPCWNSDEGLCGLASGQEAPGWNTSVTSQAMLSFFSPQRTFTPHWTSWHRRHFLGLSPQQLLTQSYRMMSFSGTCGG